MSVVITLTSATLSAAHSSTVRTLWPTSRPMSQRKASSRSIAPRSGGVRRARHQQQDVDVGAEVQLAAPVASHRNQRPGDHRGDRVRAPRLAQHHIDERRPGMHQRLDRLLGEEAGLQLLVRLAQQLTPGRARPLRLGEQGRQALQPGPAGIGGRGGQRFLEEIDVSGGHGRAQCTRRSAAPSVSTSCP